MVVSLEADNAGTSRVHSSEPESDLVGLGTRVAEDNSIRTGNQLNQPLANPNLELMLCSVVPTVLEGFRCR